MTGELAVYLNPRASRGDQHSGPEGWPAQTVFSLDDCAEARAVISSWPGYSPTPLRRLHQLAAETGVGEVLYKDEADRFGLGSFKALGGAFAVYSLLTDEVERRTGDRPSAAMLAAGSHEAIARSFTVASATAGNHGRSIAWGARMFGCPAVIFVGEGVGQARADAIAAFGAEIVRVAGDYDASVRAAAEAAEAQGWIVISDTSYPGYSEIPRRVMLGYTVMLAEVLDALGDDEMPTHAIIPAGVGGLAAAAAAYFALRLGNRRPKFVVVEPELSDCLFQSARAGQPAHASGPLGSVMLGLDCGEVSLVAFEVLRNLADAFVLIPDEAGISSMRRLNRQAGVVAGECAGAGLAVLDRLKDNSRLRAAIDLDAHSRVLLIGTEGATDAEAYRRLVGMAIAPSASLRSP